MTADELETLVRRHATAEQPYHRGIASNWTSPKVRRLIEMKESGDFSSSQIGRELGFTRNAIIGKLSRMGYRVPKAEMVNKPRKTPPRTEEQRRRHAELQRFYRMRVRGGEYVPQARPPKPPPVPPVEPLHITFADLTNKTCKWPYGEHAPFTFCGHPAKGSWCPYHHGVVFNPERSERDKQAAQRAKGSNFLRFGRAAA